MIRGWAARRVVRAFRNSSDSLMKKALWRIVGLLWPMGFAKAFFLNNRGRSFPWKGRKACLTLSFDCDHDTDYRAMPELLDVLQETGLKASFACIAKWVELDPSIHREIIRRGHELMNHTHTHPSNSHFHPNQRFNEMSGEERRQEIETADRLIRELLKYQPCGFRTPHFGDSHTEDVYEFLKGLGYTYSSSKIAIQCPEFGLPYKEKYGVWEFPLTFDPRRINTCFDTYNWFRKYKSDARTLNDGPFFVRIGHMIDLAVETGSYINIYFDPSDILMLKNFKPFLTHLMEKSDLLWIAPYRDIIGVLE